MKQEEKEKKDSSSRLILLSILAITILVIAVICLSFAAFRELEKPDSSNSISSGNISMNYTEDVNGISIVNAMPISDAVGRILKGKGEYFDFTINSTIVGSVDLDYEIAAIKDQTSTIPDNYVKLYLEKQVSGSYEEVMTPTKFNPIKEDSEIGSPVGSMILVKARRNETTNDNYRLRMWISEDAPVDQSLTYSVKINVYGKAS